MLQGSWSKKGLPELWNAQPKEPLNWHADAHHPWKVDETNLIFGKSRLMDWWLTIIKDNTRLLYLITRLTTSSPKYHNRNGSAERTVLG